MTSLKEILCKLDFLVHHTYSEFEEGFFFLQHFVLSFNDAKFENLVGQKCWDTHIPRFLLLSRSLFLSLTLTGHLRWWGWKKIVFIFFQTDHLKESLSLSLSLSARARAIPQGCFCCLNKNTSNIKKHPRFFCSTHCFVLALVFFVVLNLTSQDLSSDETKSFLVRLFLSKSACPLPRNFTALELRLPWQLLTTRLSSDLENIKDDLRPRRGKEKTRTYCRSQFVCPIRPPVVSHCRLFPSRVGSLFSTRDKHGVSWKGWDSTAFLGGDQGGQGRFRDGGLRRSGRVHVKHRWVHWRPSLYKTPPLRTRPPVFLAPAETLTPPPDTLLENWDEISNTRCTINK